MLLVLLLASVLTTDAVASADATCGSDAYAAPNVDIAVTSFVGAAAEGTVTVAARSGGL